MIIMRQIYECRKTIHKNPRGDANRPSNTDERSGYELLAVPNGIMEAKPIDSCQIEYGRRGVALGSDDPSLDVPGHPQARKKNSGSDL